MAETLQWTDVEEIGFRLCEQHPRTDPRALRFTELRQLVEALPGFAPEPGHNVNESILEAIQGAWHDERQDLEHDEDEHYTPPIPFKPDSTR